MSSMRVAPETHKVWAQKSVNSKVADSDGLGPYDAGTGTALEAAAVSGLRSGTSTWNWVATVQRYSRSVVENHQFSTFMTCVTVYALFGNDFRLSLTDTSADVGFEVCAWLCIVCFSLEMALNCFGCDTYFGGFYFWIDLVSTISILSEIRFVVDSLSSVLIGEGGSTTEMMKAGKAGRVGTRASRIIRIVRLVRMVRVVKLYKMHNSNDEAMIDNTLEPTQVGKKLTEVTTRRLILMMLTIIMVLPWLQSSSLVDSTYNFQHNFLKHLHQYPQNFNATGHVTETDFKAQVSFYVTKSRYPMIYLEVCEPQGDLSGVLNAGQCNTTWKHVDLHDWALDGSGVSGSYIEKPVQNNIGKTGVKGSNKRAMSAASRAKHRSSEYFISSHVGCYNAASMDEYYGGVRIDGPTAGGRIDGSNSKARFKSPTCISYAAFSIRTQERLLAGLAILKTFFIMVVLVVASLVFNRDAQVYVIGPIERMMTLVKQLSENPLDSANLDSTTCFDDDRKVRDQGYETILLEQTLERIGQLLQVGFGAAGAEIIGKNMHTGSGKLNPMIPGKKITAIYGFCDIRQFTDTTECLQEEVMVYVNKLGNLVHTVTHSFYGMANKNVGDAFLLSWKICDGSIDGFANFTDAASEEQRTAANECILCQATHGAARTRKHQITPSQMADAAITAFIKCQIELENENVDGCLACYAEYDAVLRRFGPGFKIQMGFGMHVGWAIEGAIGSALKIDATYLSPHVEMSDRLEASSKIFKSKLNMSHWLVNLATPGIKEHIRAIARIRCEGVPVPLTVYTFDVTNNERDFGVLDEKCKIQQLVNWNMADYTRIRRDLHPNFLTAFRAAFDDFTAGSWVDSAEGLRKSLWMKIDDGPATYILNLMDQYSNTPPEDWEGTHFLDAF
mmetsp:Transcript_13677/g.43187  ORF Transcript_13677/g.43187 Transcript_13677/m.43187 type:complete len:900 (+) Transcript_13677:213-2912(+)